MRLFLFLMLFATTSLSYGMINVFYILHDNRQEAMAAIAKNVAATHFVIAQAYSVDHTGQVSGKIDDDLLKFVQARPIRLLAMVTNRLFDPSGVHRFLADESAQDKALTILIAEAKKNKLVGIQFDFEMIPLKDKDALTKFYQKAAKLLHENGLMVSFAIAPKLTDSDFSSQYQKKLYDVWQGAYDYKALGEISDFVTIMTYDQHSQGTPPGPIASASWDEKVIQYALKHISPKKISLGIPTYSGLWYMTIESDSTKTRVRYDAVDYKVLKYILDKYKPKVVWDEASKVNYAFFESTGLNKYLFIEDAKSFAAKLALAKQYDLASISVFRLGIEDPEIWPELTGATRKTVTHTEIKTTTEQKPWWKFW